MRSAAGVAIVFTAFIVSVAASAPCGSTQGDLRSRLRPITAPIRHAGTYHVATGTWTPAASLANNLVDVVYDNSCSLAYFTVQQQGEKFQHRACLPSPSHPAVPSQFYPTGNDESPGCLTQYTIQGFRIAYCSSAGLGPSNLVDFQIEFASSYADCAGADMVPTVSIPLTGLPGGTLTGSQNCWIIDVDLTTSGQSFVLLADGDGTYAGPSTREQFGWSFGPTNAITYSDWTGPIVAGNFTWTGGMTSGSQWPCRGTDGTIWSPPLILAESGTGMASNDFFRITGNTTAPSGPGCYDFGQNPHSDFYLKLFASTDCAQQNAMTSFCHRGASGVIACPCYNWTWGPRGCNNSSYTGGAALGAQGFASLAADTVVFGTEFEKPTATSLLVQGTASIPAGAVFGQGVRCVGGTLKRLYVKTAAGGSITAPESGDVSVSARSAQLGDPIGAGQSRTYLVYYRDPIVPTGCPPSSTFNATQSGELSWRP